MMDEMSVPCWAITNNSLLQNGLPLISPGTRSLMWHSAISQVLLHTLKVCITFDRASKPELQETMESQRLFNQLTYLLFMNQPVSQTNTIVYSLIIRNQFAPLLCTRTQFSSGNSFALIILLLAVSEQVSEVLAWECVSWGSSGEGAGSVVSCHHNSPV